MTQNAVRHLVCMMTASENGEEGIDARVAVSKRVLSISSQLQLDQAMPSDID